MGNAREGDVGVPSAGLTPLSAARGLQSPAQAVPFTVQFFILWKQEKWGNFAFGWPLEIIYLCSQRQ